MHAIVIDREHELATIVPFAWHIDHRCG
jgi:hypothetical protein